MENEILFENETLYDNASHRSYKLFYYYKYKLKSTIIWLLIAEFFVVYISIYTNKALLSSKSPLPTMHIVAFVLNCIIFLLLPVFAVIVKSLIIPKLDICTMHIQFSDSFLYYEYGNSTFKLLYEDTSCIEKVCDTKDYVYFMLGKRCAFYVDKRKFIKGNPDNFSKYLEEKFSEKYKNYVR